MFTVALFIITKELKQPKYLLTNEWINKMQYVHRIEHFPAIRNEVPMHAACGQTQKHKWKKPDTEGNILFYS